MKQKNDIIEELKIHNEKLNTSLKQYTADDNFSQKAQELEIELKTVLEENNHLHQEINQLKSQMDEFSDTENQRLALMQQNQEYYDEREQLLRRVELMEEHSLEASA